MPKVESNYEPMRTGLNDECAYPLTGKTGVREAEPEKKYVAWSQRVHSTLNELNVQLSYTNVLSYNLFSEDLRVQDKKDDESKYPMPSCFFESMLSVERQLEECLNRAIEIRKNLDKII